MKTKFQTVKSWKIQSFLTITTVNSRVLINGSHSVLQTELRKQANIINFYSSNTFWT